MYFTAWWESRYFVPVLMTIFSGSESSSLCTVRLQKIALPRLQKTTRFCTGISLPTFNSTEFRVYNDMRRASDMCTVISRLYPHGTRGNTGNPNRVDTESRMAAALAVWSPTARGIGLAKRLYSGGMSLLKRFRLMTAVPVGARHGLARWWSRVQVSDACLLTRARV